MKNTNQFRISILIAIVLFSYMNLSAQGNTIYVSSIGNDSWSGSLEKPFKTIQKAAENIKPGDVCLIREGIYRETVKPIQSGSKGKPIVFKAYPGEKAVINGTELLAGWEKYQGNVYRTKEMNWSLGQENQVFFDQKFMFEARHPNDKDGRFITFDLLDPHPGTDDYSVVNRSLDKPDDFFNGGTLYLSNGTFYVYPLDITDFISKENKVKVTLSGAHKPFYAGDKDWPRETPFFMMGNLNMVDTANEWFYDEKSGQLYVYFPDGTDPKKVKVEAQKRNYAFDLVDKSYINIEDINIIGAEVFGRNTNNCRLKNVDVYAGDFYRPLYGDNIASIYYTKIETSGGQNSPHQRGAINIWGHDNVIRDCEIDHTVTNGIYVRGRNNDIVNNYVHDTGCTIFGIVVQPIFIEGYNALVSNNTACESGNTGMRFYTHESEFKYNHIYNGGYQNGDRGLMATTTFDNSHTVIHHNIIHDHLFPKHANGFYPDNESSNIIMHHNIIYGKHFGEDIQMRFKAIRFNKESFYNLIYNNTLIGEFVHWGKPFMDNMLGMELINNLFHSGTIQDHRDLFLSHNLTEQDPQFVNADGHDYSLKTNSPAIDAGMIIPGVTDDYKRDAPDLGALELNGEDWTKNVGHNFNTPPEPKRTSFDTPSYNKIYNGGFEEKEILVQEGEGLGGWSKTHSKNAVVLDGWARGKEKHTIDIYTDKHGLRLGKGADGVEQEVKGLVPGEEYIIYIYAKADQSETARVGIEEAQEGQVSVEIKGSEWKLYTVTFKTSKPETKLFLQKLSAGNGYAYMDDVCLKQKINEHK